MLEILEKYTDFDSDTLQKYLLKNGNDFWKTLYDLYKPERPKNYYLEKLKNSDPENYQEFRALTKSIKTFYYNEKFTDIEMEIMFEDKELYEKLGRPPYFKAEPEPDEIEYYIPFLSSDNEDIVTEILKLISLVPLPEENTDFYDSLGSLIISENYMIADEAIGLLMDKPDLIDRFYSELKFNLNEDRDMNHFKAVRAFWSEGTKRYEEIIPDLNLLMETTYHSQVRSMCADILKRYEVFSEEDIELKDKEKRDAEIKAIREEVARIKSTEELHRFADHFNWDDDLEYLMAVAEHEECDEATAKLIYWRGCPDYYLKFDDPDDIPVFNRKPFDLIRFVQKRVKNKMYKKVLEPYNPSNDHGMDRTCDVKENETCGNIIPDYMY